MMILFTQKSSPNDDDDFAHPNLMMIMLTPAAKAAKSTAIPPEMIEVEEALVPDCTLSWWSWWSWWWSYHGNIEDDFEDDSDADCSKDDEIVSF